MTTIQFDFNLPDRFDMTYIDADGQKKRPYMVHRALLGSLERFFGVYLESTAGAFPVWLAPDQVAVIPVGPDFNDYAVELNNKLRSSGMRSIAMLDEDRMNAKIRRAQQLKIPYMAVVGAKEREEQAVSVRCRDGKQLGTMSTEAFMSYIMEKIAQRSLDL